MLMASQLLSFFLNHFKAQECTEELMCDCLHLFLISSQIPLRAGILKSVQYTSYGITDSLLPFMSCKNPNILTASHSFSFFEEQI